MTIKELKDDIAKDLKWQEDYLKRRAKDFKELGIDPKAPGNELTNAHRADGAIIIYEKLLKQLDALQI